ncbi:MAG TPA: glycosyltransferase family 4 protein [Candidatus Brocadiaceae bacterium]|nr:glycosyltransferase family 4 protein [Candidatus Woesearchaeota archaeon]
MRILVISFYFEPDLCAGSFRTSSFVKALRNAITAEDTVDVITTLPNRYGSYRVETSELEIDSNITIRRIRVPFHKSGFYDQAKSFFVYFFNSLRFVRSREYDVVFATSSRLFSAFLGAVISKCKRKPLYLDIRDIFTDTLQSILGKTKLKYIIPVFLLVEKFVMESAGKINLVSKGFDGYFLKKYKKNYSYFTNGIDDEFIEDSLIAVAVAPIATGKIIFTYTGNIGEGQGLEKIVPYIAARYKNIEFIIIGDGGRKGTLEKSITHLHNVKIIAPINRKDLIAFYKKSDILFLHLNSYEAFKKVLPSKIFEYAAMYKPIIAGVDGYSKEFLEENLPDSLIFRPCDIDDFCMKYENYSGIVDVKSRKRFIAKFSRQNIMNEMAGDFLDFSRKTVKAVPKKTQ